MGICTEENESNFNLSTNNLFSVDLSDILSTFLFYIKGRELSYKGLSLSTTTLKSTSYPMTAHNMNGIINHTGSASNVNSAVARLLYS
jgi:hypothetical protein